MNYPYLTVSTGRTQLAALRTNLNRRKRPETDILFKELPSSSYDGVTPVSLLPDMEKSINAKTAERYFNQGNTKDQVEAILAEQLYRQTAHLPAQALTDPDFWRFLATSVLTDFVHWRDGENCSLASFGLNSIRRIPDCVPLRMFNRAHIVHQIGNPTISPLEAMKLGGTDYWQSHVFRVQNRFDPGIIEVLNEGWFDNRISDVQAIRQIAKRIRQQRANLVLELQTQPAKKATLNQIIGDFERDSHEH